MFSLDKHTKKKGTLCVAVEQAKDLPETVETDPVVTLRLLPDDTPGDRKTTKVIKSTSKPTWAEKFSYENIELEELSRSRVLEVAVWNVHEGVGNVFIGGLRLGPAPGSEHLDWMDSIRDEVIHWEDMLAHPREWVEQWHTLRTTMKPALVEQPKSS